MANDLRVSAAVGAWDRLDEAYRVMQKWPDLPGAKAAHSRLVREAEVYASVAAISGEVGVAAGEYLSERDRQEEAVRKRDKEAIEGLFDV